jgi:2,4-dienoyl-CoA reductase-like NADH-dependent reductase (Old Yellow Enzyme family)
MRTKPPQEKRLSRKNRQSFFENKKGMSTMAEIFKELKTKNFTFKNRVILAPVATKSTDDSGYVTDKIPDYYDKRSKGGYLSLIITEHVYVTENS